MKFDDFLKEELKDKNLKKYMKEIKLNTIL